MQWNVEQAKTHAQRPGEYFPPFNRIFSFVLPYLSHGRTAQLGWLDRNPRGYIVGLKISKPFLPQTQLGFLLPKILEIFSASASFFSSFSSRATIFNQGFLIQISRVHLSGRLSRIS